MQLYNFFKAVNQSKKLIYLISLGISITILLFFYFIQVTFVYKIPFWSNTIIVPIIVGVIVGLLLGKSANMYIALKKSLDLKENLGKQRILNKILIKSKENVELEPFLESVLQLVINTPFAELEKKGGIFLKQPDGRYRIAVQVNLPREIVEGCALKGITEGECLCGLAIQERRPLFCNHVDERHTIRYPGMPNHGHYSFPIMRNNEVFGAMVLYLEAGHKHSTTEEGFLKSVVDVLSLVIYNHNIHERQKLNNEIVANAKQFAGIGSWQMDLPSGTIFWSDEIFKMLGYKPQSVAINKPFLKKITHPDDSFKLKEAIAKATNGIPFDYEVRYIDKMGVTLYVINKCTPFKNKKGDVVKLVGTVVDLSEIKKNEEQIAEKEAFIESIASSTPYALYLLDIESNKMLFTNQEFDKQVNSQIATLFEDKGIKAFNQFFHKDDLQGFVEKTEEILIGNEDFYSFTGRFAYNGENYRWINQRFRPFKRDAKGNITQVLMVTIDIHKQKEAENSVRALNRKLTDKNLKLNKANKELDRFIYSASHDFKGPISSILGLLQLWELDKKLTNTPIYVDGIKKSVLKLDDFIRDLTDFSSNAHRKLVPSQINLATVANQTFEHLLQIFGNAKAKLIIKDEINGNSITDLDRIGIVVRNILANSIVYSKESEEAKIELKLTQKDGSVCVICKDNGIGIEEESMNKVFDMFFRGNIKSTGSGLGLYIAKESVEKLGGKISISSKIGKGTEVVIEFPELTLN